MIQFDELDFPEIMYPHDAAMTAIRSVRDKWPDIDGHALATVFFRTNLDRLMVQRDDVVRVLTEACEDYNIPSAITAPNGR